MGLIASNPKHPKEELTSYLNACGGCYSPSVISPQMVNTPYDSPLTGLAPRETYAWLDDRTVHLGRRRTACVRMDGGR